ncbi:MAG TPA: HEAT repeat domain-containing protein [Candidatus Limnocylindria bacterium]|nr:HEAT repeat domain-containing protein [Candidatus Limnocylindria bacterium]
MQTFPHRFALGLATLACAATCLAAEPREGRLTALAQLVHDPAPRVRLEALRALAKIPSAQSAELALSVLDQPMDPNLDYALWLTINDLSGPWIIALQNGTWKPEGREKQLEFALRAIKPEQASQVLGQLLAKHPLTRDGNGPWIELIGSAGTEKELRVLLDQVLNGGFDDAASARALKSLADATRLRKLKPGGSTVELGKLFDSSSDAVRVEALKLAAVWKDLGPYFPKLAALAGSTGSSPAVRTAAFDTLRAIGGAGALDALKALSAAGQETAIRQQAVAALATVNLGVAVPAIVDVAKSLADETQAQDFWRAILPVKGAGKAVAEALPASGIPQPAARAGMRVAREGGRSDMDLVMALAKASGLAADTQAFTGQLIKDLAAKAAEKGDPNRGELIFRRADLACLSCHAIGGAGGKVGPDLTSIGASAPIDYLVESVLLPNAKIKEGYHSLIVTTKDGTEYTGTLARETPQEIVLRNAAGAEQAIAKADVEKREQGTLSLMPGGLLDPLGAQDQLDLFAFLSRLGKPGDFDASKGGVARKWRLYVETHTDQQNGQGNAMWDAPLDSKLWSPLYSLVSGRLTRPVMDAASQRQMWVGYLAVYAATELQTAQAGPVKLNLESTAGEVWVDGKKIGGPGESTVTLPAGKHRVIVKLDPKVIPDSLRLVSDAGFVLN